MSGESWLMTVGVIGTLLSALYVVLTPPSRTVTWIAMSGQATRRKVEHCPAAAGHRAAAVLALLSTAMVLLAATGLVVDS